MVTHDFNVGDYASPHPPAHAKLIRESHVLDVPLWSYQEGSAMQYMSLDASDRALPSTWACPRFVFVIFTFLSTRSTCVQWSRPTCCLTSNVALPRQ